MRGRVAVGVLAVGAIAWFALVVLAPVAPVPLAAAVYGIGSLVCHQLSERSFHWHGAQLAVCARCTGIYLGACAIAVVAPLPPSSYVWWAATPARIGRLLAVAAMPMAATVAAERAGWWFPSSGVRAVTGALVGAAAAIVVAAVLAAEPRTQPRA